MPLCPQITITPVTVTSTGMTQTSVIAANDPATTEQLTVVSTSASAAAAEAAAADAAAAAAVVSANAAAAAAGAAQATANTALANAATAYAEAIGSLQPSASTIVNASNQMTAIAANGITVYSGSSASSGARVVLNSTGLAGFNSGGTTTFSISATTGAAVFSGSVTGSTITGGELNIAGNAIINSSGLLTATGATITGTVNATAGYFGTATNGFSISSTGLVGVGTGTIVGGAISGTNFTNGSTFSVSSTGYLIAAAGTIGGFTIQSTYLSGSGGFTLYSNGIIDGGLSNTIFYGYANIGGGTATGERFIVTGNSSFVGQATFSGNTTSQTHFFSPFATNVTSAANGYWVTSGSGRMTYTTASSQRYKHDIVDLVSIPEYDPKKLLNLPVRAFRYNEDYVTPTDDRAEVLIPGFIAEEVDAIYPIACDYSETKGPESWNDRVILPAMLALIQEQEARIQALEGK